MSFQLGEARSGPSLAVLYDIGTALTSGYLSHHLRIKEKCPEVVHSYEAFDGDRPFDPINLLRAISNTNNYDPEKHGMLEVVIQYYTSYKNYDGH